MKFTIDTTAKTIRIEESVNLNDIINQLESIFPNGAWKEYKLESHYIVNNPIYVPYEGFPYYPTYPFYPTSPIIDKTTTDGLVGGSNYCTEIGIIPTTSISSFATTINTSSAASMN